MNRRLGLPVYCSAASTWFSKCLIFVSRDIQHLSCVIQHMSCVIQHKQVFVQYTQFGGFQSVMSMTSFQNHIHLRLNVDLRTPKKPLVIDAVPYNSSA